MADGSVVSRAAKPRRDETASQAQSGRRWLEAICVSGEPAAGSWQRVSVSLSPGRSKQRATGSLPRAPNSRGGEGTNRTARQARRRERKKKKGRRATTTRAAARRVWRRTKCAGRLGPRVGADWAEEGEEEQMEEGRGDGRGGGGVHKRQPLGWLGVGAGPKPSDWNEARQSRPPGIITGGVPSLNAADPVAAGRLRGRALGLAAGRADGLAGLG